MGQVGETNLTIEELGKEGEAQARLLLKKMGFMITQPDWLGIKDDKWFQFEVKRKERFTPPPFEGHGLNLYQVERRLDLFKKNNLRPYFLVWEIGTDIWFGEWLDVLESKEKITTRNKIRIYPLKNFKII